MYTLRESNVSNYAVSKYLRITVLMRVVIG